MKVAVCNLRDSDFGDKLLKSTMKTGFAVLTHHGIDHGLIRETQQAWREFFLKPNYYKQGFRNQDPNLGFSGIGSETAVGSNISDIKEFFHWKPGQNSMPEATHLLTERMFFLLEDVGRQILSVLERRANATYVKDCEQSSNTLFRTLYYPALKEHSGLASVGAVRASAHEDINHVTLLVAASAAGLQVQDTAGNWHDVPHEENSITVNIGDMLQLASDGLFKSTTHRVVNPIDDSSDRISMPLFIHPQPYTMLAPGITAGQFLKQRLDEIYGNK